MVLRNIFFCFYTTFVSRYVPEQFATILPKIDMGPHWRAMEAKLDTYREIKTNLLMLNNPGGNQGMMGNNGNNGMMNNGNNVQNNNN